MSTTMHRLIALTISLTACAAAGGASAGTVPLKGAVTDAYTISVTQGGKKVKTLHPGSYLLTVNDQSTIHDFHLFGPGVNKKTAVAFHGTVTWTVKLVRGTYRYQCDPHSHFMHGSFTVALR